MKLASEELDFAIFDCDGVVVDSNQLKSDGFEAALKDQPAECIQAFLTHHKENGGISRFVKFRRFFTETNPRDDPEAAIDHALSKYASFLRKALLEANLIPGAEDLLSELSSRDIAIIMISGGKETEVQWLMREKGLADHFHSILGSPVSKLEHLQRLQAEDRLAGSGIYFGDGAGDWQASREYDIPFCFVNDASEWEEGKKLAEQGSFTSVSDLTEVHLQ
jgi:phosphoglycolate phosphatase-like HAD superfamily hydrolase